MRYAWLAEVSNAEAVRLINRGVDQIYVSLGRESDVRCLTMFKPHIDPRLSLHPNATLRNRPIGLLGNAEVWVKEWEPSPEDEEHWTSDRSDMTFAEWAERQRA